jgi:hypothetical protein
VLAHRQERPRLSLQPGFDHCLYSVYLRLIDGSGNPVVPDNLNYSWGLEYWESKLGIEAAKKIPGKQWGIHNLDPVRPTLFELVQWDELFVTLSF